MKKVLLILLISIVSISSSAQVGIGLVVGANMTDEFTEFKGIIDAESNETTSLKGLVIGPTAELMIPKVGIGLEVASLYSKKGSNFSYTLDNFPSYSVLLEGFRSIDYLEVPVCLKWRFGPRDFKAFIEGGYFWGFAFNGTVAVETAEDLLNGNQSISELINSSSMNFGDNSSSKYNFIDKGYTIGAGIDILRTIQLGVYYTYSTISLTNEESMNDLLSDPTYSFSDGDYENLTQHGTISVRLTYILTGGR